MMKNILNSNIKTKSMQKKDNLVHWFVDKLSYYVEILQKKC